MVVDDLVCRTVRREDRDGVDDGDDRRDQDHPAELLEEPQERPARAGVGSELREIGSEVEVLLPRHDRDEPEADRCYGDPAPRPQGKREVDEAERRRHHRRRDDSDGRPERDRTQMRRDRVPRHDRSCENDEERDAAQYGGVSLHHSPSTLKAFQNAVFAGCSSSDSSMSGVTSPWIVGVSSCSSPSTSASSRASGKRAALRKATAGSPITTTSFGWTMCSSRRRKGRDSSSSPPANLRQFVP